MTFDNVQFADNSKHNVDATHKTEETKMIYVAIKTFENGTREEAEFDVYTDMVEWFAKTQEAGISAYVGFTEDAVNQEQLQADVWEFQYQMDLHS